MKMRTTLTIVLFLTLAGTVDAQNSSQGQESSESKQIWFIFPDRPENAFPDPARSDRPIESLAPYTGIQPGSENSSPPLRAGIEVSFDSDRLGDRFGEFVEDLEPVLRFASGKIGQFAVEQIELTVSITAEGKVGVLASASLGSEAGIKLILRRRE